jgi:hypothetical protein
MGLLETQRMISSKKNRLRKNGKQKTTFKLFIPSGVTIFFTGKIGRCRHELIPLDPLGSRTKQNVTRHFP